MGKNKENRKNNILEKVKNIKEESYSEAVLVHKSKVKKTIPESEQRTKSIQGYVTEKEKEDFLNNIPNRKISESDMVRILVQEFNKRHSKKDKQ